MHPKISHQNVKKHLCKESDPLYMIKDQTSFQGSFKDIDFSDKKTDTDSSTNPELYSTSMLQDSTGHLALKNV